MKTIQYSLAQGIAHVVFNQPDSPVNTMCLEWQADMHSLAEQIVKDKAQIKGVILSSAKTTFFAGADLKAFMRTEQTDGPAFFQQIEKFIFGMGCACHVPQESIVAGRESVT